MASLQKNYPYRKKKEKYQEISDMVLIELFSIFQPARKDFRFHYKDNGVIVIPQFRSVIGVAKESRIINQNIGSDSI